MADEKMYTAIKNAQTCARVCNETISYCLSMGEEHAKETHIKLMIDCAAICDLSANFMARSSDFHSEVCDVCANICEACAESCEELEGEEMDRCAEACTTCAESCREMVV